LFGKTFRSPDAACAETHKRSAPMKISQQRKLRVEARTFRAPDAGRAWGGSETKRIGGRSTRSYCTSFAFYQAFSLPYARSRGGSGLRTEPVPRAPAPRLDREVGASGADRHDAWSRLVAGSAVLSGL